MTDKINEDVQQVIEPISLNFLPTNEDMTQYSIDLHLPESYKSLPAAPAVLYDVAAIHFFLRSDENMTKIMEYFDNKAEDFQHEHHSIDEYETQF